MGKILDFIKRVIFEPEQEPVPPEGEVSITHNGITYNIPRPIAPDDYGAMRRREVAWLESTYDFNTPQGIHDIKVSANLPKMPGSGVTGDVDYYLHKKASEHEKAGEFGLAALCLKKSNEIRMLKNSGYRKSDFYALVRLLARHGYVERAEAEKAKIDDYFGEEIVDVPNGQEIYARIVRDAKSLDTDLVIMTVHGNTCPECAKHQGRVFSLSGRDTRFPMLCASMGVCIRAAGMASTPICMVFPAQT